VREEGRRKEERKERREEERGEVGKRNAAKA